MRARSSFLVVALWLAPLMAGASPGAIDQAGRVGAPTPAAIEQEVRRLDAREAEAVLRGDLAVLDELWADDFIVNNPGNTVGLGHEGPVRKGLITYSSFQRIAEFVALRGDVVIVMGREVVVPKAPTANAGRTLHRRYTNVWMRTTSGWRLTARHANVIPEGPQ